MNTPCAPSSWRGLRSFLGARLLGAQASLPACFGQSVLLLIVTAFLHTTSPSFFAQTNDCATTANGAVTLPVIPPGFSLWGVLRRTKRRREGILRNTTAIRRRDPKEAIACQSITSDAPKAA